MTKKKRHKHTTSDKARIFAQVISQQQPDAVAPSGQDIAEILKGISFDISIGRKERKSDG